MKKSVYIVALGLLALQGCSTKIDKANDLVAKATSIVKTRTLDRDSLRTAYDYAENALRLADYDSTASTTTINPKSRKPISLSLELQGDINRRLFRLPYDSLRVACEDLKSLGDKAVQNYQASLRVLDNPKIYIKLAEFDEFAEIGEDEKLARKVLRFSLAGDCVYQNMQSVFEYMLAQYKYEKKYPYTEIKVNYPSTRRIITKALSQTAKTEDEEASLRNLREILNRKPEKFKKELEKLTASLN